jgi:hypothetical protein
MRLVHRAFRRTTAGGIYASPVTGPTYVDATIGGKRLRRGARLSDGPASPCPPLGTAADGALVLRGLSKFPAAGYRGRDKRDRTGVPVCGPRGPRRPMDYCG